MLKVLQLIPSIRYQLQLLWHITSICTCFIRRTVEYNTSVMLKQFAPNFHVVAEQFTCCTRIIYTKLSDTLLSQCSINWIIILLILGVYVVYPILSYALCNWFVPMLLDKLNFSQDTWRQHYPHPKYNRLITRLGWNQGLPNLLHGVLSASLDPVSLG